MATRPTCAGKGAGNFLGKYKKLGPSCVCVCDVQHNRRYKQCLCTHILSNERQYSLSLAHTHTHFAFLTSLPLSLCRNSLSHVALSLPPHPSLCSLDLFTNLQCERYLHIRILRFCSDCGAVLSAERFIEIPQRCQSNSTDGEICDLRCKNGSKFDSQSLRCDDGVWRRRSGDDMSEPWNLLEINCPKGNYAVSVKVSRRDLVLCTHTVTISLTHIRYSASLLAEGSFVGWALRSVPHSRGNGTFLSLC